VAWTLRRNAARVVLLDREGRVLLLRAFDPADPTKRPWWEIPGGGLEGTETSEDAARRELREETGIAGAQIGPCVWVQHAVFDFGGYHFDQHERIHVAWCDGDGELCPTELEALEAVAFTARRWWTITELQESDEPVMPPRLRELLPPLVAGRLPDPPIEIGLGYFRRNG
jgi:8-oxo-dGTP pyrophosphatase MutT (NUDIX family)